MVRVTSKDFSTVLYKYGVKILTKQVPVGYGDASPHFFKMIITIEIIETVEMQLTLTLQNSMSSITQYDHVTGLQHSE